MHKSSPAHPASLPAAHFEDLGGLRVGVGSVQKTASTGRAVREGRGGGAGRQGDGADEAGAVVHSVVARKQQQGDNRK